MKKRLFLLFSALSMVLCGVTAFMWVRTYSDAYELSATRSFGSILGEHIDIRFGAEHIYKLMVFRGKVRFVWHQDDPGKNAHLIDAVNDGWQFYHGPGEIPDDWFEEDSWMQRRGFEHSYWNRDDGSWKQQGTVTGAPLWFVCVLSGLLPASCVHGIWRRRIRQQRLQCTNCGYDLRGTAGRCPECGQNA